MDKHWSNVAIIFGLTVHAQTNCEKSEIVVAGIDSADVSCLGFGLKVGHHQPAKADDSASAARLLMALRDNSDWDVECPFSGCRINGRADIAFRQRLTLAA
jgi:hypothetical protein